MGNRLRLAAYLVGMTTFGVVADAGLWPGGVVDPEHVREAVAAFPPA